VPARHASEDVYEEGDNEDEVEDEDDLYFEESDEEVSDFDVLLG
jgi:hypothetical protein